jgi:hypothetical protein
MGEGRRDAVAGALGMLAGAALFVRAYPTIEPVLGAGDYGKVTLPRATRTSPWPWVGAIGAIVAVANVLSEGSRRTRRASWFR